MRRPGGQGGEGLYLCGPFAGTPGRGEDGLSQIVELLSESVLQRVEALLFLFEACPASEVSAGSTAAGARSGEAKALACYRDVVAALRRSVIGPLQDVDAPEKAFQSLRTRRV
jgi:hypothetical protein